jgi:uncharacterized DUF497 family protein
MQSGKRVLLSMPGSRLSAASSKSAIPGQIDASIKWGYNKQVKITFDPAKQRAALAERGLDFADAVIVFTGMTITVEDVRRDYGEIRYQTVGFLAGRMVMVVWTPRNEARHVISMRKCNDREKTIYQKRFDEV